MKLKTITTAATDTLSRNKDIANKLQVILTAPDRIDQFMPQNMNGIPFSNIDVR